MPSLFDELKTIASTSADGKLVMPAELAIDLLTRAGGGQPLDPEVAHQYVGRFVRDDGMIPLEEFCAAHNAEMAEPLPGFLVAAQPGKEYLEDSDDEENVVTNQDGDGPPSTDDESESKDTLGDMEGTIATWSHTGGSRESSFRRRDPEKIARAEGIRSSCLTSHLVTPVFRGRKLVLDKPPAPMPAGAAMPNFSRRK